MGVFEQAESIFDVDFIPPPNPESAIGDHDLQNWAIEPSFRENHWYGGFFEHAESISEVGFNPSLPGKRHRGS